MDDKPDPVALALAEIVARLDRIENALTGLRNAQPSSPATVRRLLSLRAAARLLGVDRGTTLHDLIKDRRIRVVTVAGRPRIALSEIERIEREGTIRYQSRPTHSKLVRTRLAGDVGARIRAIKID